MPRRRIGLRQMDGQPEARPHCTSAKMLTPAKEERGEVERLHAFCRGLATNLHEMGVPTKVIRRVCRHADEATTEEAVHPRHRTGNAKAGSVDNTRETRETLNI